MEELTDACVCRLLAADEQSTQDNNIREKHRHTRPVLSLELVCLAKCRKCLLWWPSCDIYSVPPRKKVEKLDENAIQCLPSIETKQGWEILAHQLEALKQHWMSLMSASIFIVRTCDTSKHPAGVKTTLPGGCMSQTLHQQQ